MVGLSVVLCVSRACPCYHEPSRRKLDELPSSAEFGGESVFWLRRWLFLAERPSDSSD